MCASMLQITLVHKKPELKQQVDPIAKKYFKSLVQTKYKEPLSDYNRSITKSYEKKSNRQYNQRTKQILQLGEQPNQTIPPLKVLSKKDEATAEFVVQSNLSKAQLRGDEQVPIHLGSSRKLFVLVEPLMHGQTFFRCYQRECVSCINGT